MATPREYDLDSPRTWADPNCKRCNGAGMFPTSGGRNDPCLGWRWCDCAKAARDQKVELSE